MAGRKQEHLNQVIRQKLAQLLHKEAADPRFSAVTITEVSVSKDLSTARVMFSCYLPDANPAGLTESLNKAAGFLSHALGRTLSVRRTPRLHFHYDPGFDYAADMDTVLKELDYPDE